MSEFYFNTETRQVEEGKPSSWMHRMGPYPTREAAARALQTARERTTAWQDEEDSDREN